MKQSIALFVFIVFSCHPFIPILRKMKTGLRRTALAITLIYSFPDWWPAILACLALSSILIPKGPIPWTE